MMFLPGPALGTVLVRVTSSGRQLDGGEVIHVQFREVAID
jgi:hypothetical protein